MKPNVPQVSKHEKDPFESAPEWFAHQGDNPDGPEDSYEHRLNDVAHGNTDFIPKNVKPPF